MADHSNIEARKLSIIEYLADLQDEGILQQIENLLKPRNDFWDELSDTEKSIILKGIKSLDDGKSIPFSKLIERYKK